MIPQKILFISEGQLGDLLLLTPALRATKVTFPHTKITVLVVGRQAKAPSLSSSTNRLGIVIDPMNSVLATNANVDEILYVDRGTLRSLSGLRRLKAELLVVKSLREKKFDTVVCTFPEDRFALWAFASGAKIRVGQKHQAFHLLLTHKPNSRKELRGVLEYYCDLVGAIGVAVNSKQTEFRVPESSKQWVEEFSRKHGIGRDNKLVAVHPGATGNYKIWPPESYAQLIDRLQSKTDLRVVLCHGVQDWAIIAALQQRLRSAVLRADTSDDVGKLGVLLERCRLCISNDSGPRHLAAALGVPSLAILRQYHDREWNVYPEDDMHATLQGRERCPVCPAGVCLDKIPEGEQFGSYCMRMISVEEALQKVCRLLGF